MGGQVTGGGEHKVLNKKRDLFLDSICKCVCVVVSSVQHHRGFVLILETLCDN